MLGGKIKELRTKNNRTQGELAEYCGISQKAVSRWEVGSAEPSQESLRKIAEFFGITIGELFGDEVVKEYDPVRELLDRLVAQKIITDPDNIPESVAKMIIDAVRMDMRMKQAKQDI